MDSVLIGAWTRRRLGLITGALATSPLGLVSLSEKEPGAAAAKKRKRKRKCRKRKKSGPVTCAEVCPEEGGFAFHLFGGGDVCATGADTGGCIECTTGSECFDADPLRFFCVQDFTDLSTGAVEDFSGLCGPYTQGICVVFEPCVLES